MNPCISVRRRVSGCVLALLAASAIPSPASAQQAAPGADAGALQSEAGRLRQDLEDRLEPRPLEDGDAVTAPPREEAPGVPSGGPTFVLTRVAFNASHFLTQAELAAIVAPFVGRAVDFAGIQAILNAVNARYAQMGIVTASATLPEQELEGGVLRVELVEGRVGDVAVEGAATAAGYVRSRVRLERNAVVDVSRLSGRIAAQNRVGEARIRTALQPGAEFGQTDVLLSVTEPKRNLLDVFADNFGSPSTGRYQAGALFQHYGMLGADDRLKLYGVYSAGNLAGNASYTFGFAPTGARLGLSYSYSQMRIIDGAFVDLGVAGHSHGGGVNLVQPVVSSANWLALVNLGANVNRSITRQGGVTVTDNITLKPSAGVSFNYYGPKLAVSFAPSYALGRTALGVTGNTELVHFFNGNAALTGLLPGDFVVRGFGAWQVASKPLVTGDQLFQIGGPTTVRGYEGNAAAGGSGYYANLELHRSFSGAFGEIDLFAFVDHGAVFSTSPARVSLTAVGLGASYSYRDRITLELTGGVPVGERLPGQPDFAIFGRIIGRLF